MTQLCINIYRYFRNHRPVYWFLMIALFAVLGYFSSKIYLEEDIDKLMPSSKNEDGSIKLAFANLRIKDKTFLLFEGKEGASVERISETCDAFIDTLLSIEASRDSSQRVIGDIFYRLPEDIIYDAVDYLSSRFPAYIDTTLYSGIDSMLTREHFVRQMQENREDMLTTVGEMFPELIEMDPIGLRTALMKQLPLGDGMTSGYSTLNDHFFVSDSSVCVAFITPMFSATNTGQGSAMFEMLNSQIERFSATNPDIKISYHGTPASGYYNSTTIKADLIATMSISMAIVLIMLFICFRNRSTIPLLVLPVVFGTLFGLTLMYFIKGQFSLLALGIGAVVLGVAMSYVLHVLTHYKYVSDPEQVLRDEVKPVCLGCLTTVGSFLGIIFIRTELLQDFGLFATFAIVGTTLFSLIFLPPLLSADRNKVNRKAFALIDRINSYPVERQKWLLCLILLVTLVAVGFYLVGGTRFDADMHNLGYEAPNTTYSENLLRDKTYTGDKEKYFASSGKTMEEALENFTRLSRSLDSLQAIGLVKSYTPTSKIFVPLKEQQVRIDAWKSFWTPERLSLIRQLINETAPLADLSPEAFERFFSVAQADYTPEPLYEAGLIPVGYQSTMMEQSYNGDYLCFTSVRCANDSVRSSQSDYIRICDAIANQPDLLVLDTYYYTTDTLLQLNDDFNVLQWISMFFVLIVLLFSFRFNIFHTILAFMPIVLSWVIVLGFMVIFDVRFNLINIIISTFIFGIGVDYSIFVMNGLVGGKDDTRLLSYHKTAILFSAFILVVSVGSMLCAKHPAIKSVGFATLVGLLSAVIISYVVQPALFRLFTSYSQRKKQK